MNIKKMKPPPRLTLGVGPWVLEMLHPKFFTNGFRESDGPKGNMYRNGFNFFDGILGGHLCQMSGGPGLG